MEEKEQKLQQDYSKLTLVQKILEVKKIIKLVKKNGHVDFNSTKYSYQTAEDIDLAVRDACNEVGIVIIPAKFEVVRIDNNIITTIQTYQVINSDNPTEIFECSMGGQGKDSGDKQIYKAETGAMKYLLKQLFQIPAQDTDPDAISSDELAARESDSLDWKDFSITFGKNKGKTLGELSQDSQGVGYIKWLANNGKDEAKKYANMALKEINDGSGEAE